MKDTAPKEQGIIVVALVFGVIAAGVAIVMFDFGAVGGIFIGLIVATIAAIALLLGWREAKPMDQNAPAPTAKSAPAPGPSADPAPAPAPAPDTAAPPAATIEDVVTKVTEGASTAQNPIAPDGKPATLSEPREGGADDLKKIKGVGPKLEKLLNSMGFWHFDQVASWRSDEVAWVDQNLEGFKGRVSRDNWVDQAKTLAAGEATAFSEKVDKGKVY